MNFDVESDHALMSVTTGRKKTTVMIRHKAFPAETRPMVMAKTPAGMIQVDTQAMIDLGWALAQLRQGEEPQP